MRKTLQRTALSGAAAVVSLAGMFTPAGAAAPGWRIVHTSTAKTVGTDQNYLHGITAISAKDVWAVGSVYHRGGQYDHSLAQHWNGRKWTDTTLPLQFRKSTTISSFLQVVASSSSTNVWAFGSSGPAIGGSRTQYALRWDGKRWSVVHSWNTLSSVYDAVVLSPTNVWVFGTAGDAFAWHFDGNTWTEVNTPGFEVITASAVSPTNIWAVVSQPIANTLRDRRLVAHYDGHAWSLVKTPKIPVSVGDTPGYQAVHARSSKDVWVVGGRKIRTSKGDQAAPIALHWNGTKWQRYDGPIGRQRSDASLYSLVPDGKGGIWATRGPDTQGDPVHLVGGKWTVAPLPKVKGRSVSLGQLAQAPGSTSIWSTGFLIWSGISNDNGVVLRYP